MIKLHDWLAAVLNNPDYEVGDFRAVGLNTDNTQLLSIDEYKDKSLIKEKFTKENGEFDDEGFSKFYETMAQQYGALDSEPLKFKYDLFDYSRFNAPEKERRVDDPNFNIFRVSNPTGVTKSIAGINDYAESGLSSREWAQTQNIYNTETGKFEEYSPNDHALVVNPLEWLMDIGRDPLVLAVYDLDTEDEDPITGEMIKHKKGEYKLNKEGKPYYETLNGRNIGNKLLLSTFDVLTVDAEGINKYDVFDADGLDKDVASSISSAAWRLAPLLIPGFGEYYVGIMTGVELLKTLPMLDGLIGALSNNEDTFLTPIFNSVAGKATQLSVSQSDYGQQNFFSVEGLSNLATDIALQWGQQKLIIQGINKLKGFSNIGKTALKLAEKTYLKEAGKHADDITKEFQLAINSAKTVAEKEALASEMEKTLKAIVGTRETWKESQLGLSLIAESTKNALLAAEKSYKLGSDISLAYMALVSNTDVYQDMIEQGLTKREATLVTLGSVAGMFLVDKYSGLGKIFFDEELAMGSLAMRRGFKEMAGKWAPLFKSIKVDKNLTKGQKIRKFFTEGKNFGKATTTKFIDDLQYHTLSGLGKATAEALEEVSEEVITDLSKQIYEFGRDLGFDTTTDNVGAFDDVWNNPSNIKPLLARYGANFFGGFLGGSIFYGREYLMGNKAATDTNLQKLTFLVRNNKTEKLLKYLNDQHKKGNFGNTSLSANPLTDESGNYILTEDGKFTYGTAKKGEETQNDFIYNRLREMVLLVDGIIKEYGLNATEKDLYKSLTFNEKRFEALEDFLEGTSYDTNYYETYLDLVNNFVDIERRLRSLVAPDLKSSDEYTKYEEDLADLTKRKEIALQQIEDFKSGKTSMKYLRAMLVSIDPRINPKFLKLSFETWLKNEELKNINLLTPSELEYYKKKYLEEVKPLKKWDMLKKYEEFINIEEKVLPELLTLLQEVKDFKSWHDKIEELFNEDSPFSKIPNLTEDSLLDDETEDSEDYIFRNTPKEGESAEDFQNRRKLRTAKLLLKLREIETQQLEEALKILREGKFIDINTKRRLLTGVGRTRQSIVRQLKRIVPEGYIPLAYRGEVDEIIDELKYDLSNLDEVYKKLDRYVLNITGEALDYSISGKASDFNTIVSEILEQPGLSAELLVQALAQAITESTGGILYSEETKNQFINSPFILELKERLIASDVSEAEAEEIVNSLIDSIERGEGENLFDDLSSVEFGGTKHNYYDLLRFDPENEEEVLDFSKVSDFIEQQKSFVRQRLDELVNNIENDPYWNFINEIENLSYGNNPIVNIVKKIGLTLNRDFGNVESLLQRLYDRAVLQDMSNFVMSPEESLALDEAEDLLTRALGYIFATYDGQLFRNVFPHNPTINLIAKKHKIEDWLPLPELDEQSAKLYESEILGYLAEIGIRQGNMWSPGSWRYWSVLNSSNRAKKFIDTEINYTRLKRAIFDSNRDKFKGNDFDLLEGIETLEKASDERVYLHRIEDLFYNNVHRLLEERKITFGELLAKTSIDDIFQSRAEIAEQNTTLLNDSVTNLSATSKAMYILSIAGISSTDFYTFLEKEVTKYDIAPIITQKDVNRTALAMMNSLANKDTVWKSGLEYFYKISGSKAILLRNVVSIFGNGGAGKTKACAKILRDFVEDIKESVWLLAPGTNQLQALQNDIKNAESYVVDDAVKKLLTGGTFNIENLEGVASRVLQDNVTAKITNLPKCIIIDESTHVDSETLQKLNNLAEQYNISIIALGDNIQNGYYSSTTSGEDEYYTTNIGWPETFFCGRTNRLGITLRDGNIQKYSNTTLLGDIVLSILDFPNELLKKIEVNNQVGEQIKKFKFLYYLGDVLNGEIITKTINEELLNVLKLAKEQGKKIAFIGDENSVYYNQIKEYGVEQFSEFDVQGKEFDYVIVDKDWTLDDSNDNPNFSILAKLNFLQSLYTLSTRSREGTIIIDNGLTEIIKPSERLNIKSAVTPFTKEVIENFKQLELLFIKSLNLKEKKVEKKEPEPITGNLIEDANSIIDLMNNTSDLDKWNELNIKLEKIKDEIRKKGLNDSTLHKLEPFKKQDEPDEPDLDEPDLDNSISFDEPDEILTEKDSFNWLGYSNTHFLGVPRVREEIEGNEVFKWLLSEDLQLERDVKIFAEPDDLDEDGNVVDGKVKRRLVNRLLNFKSTIIFGKKFNSELINLTKDEYDGITFGLAISRKFDSSFVGETILDNSEKYITTNEGNEFVFRLVARFKHNGKDCEVTLALLSNPETTEEKKRDIIRNREEIISKLEKKIEKNPTLEALYRPVINDMKTFMSELENGNYVKAYKNWLSEISKNIPADLSESYLEIDKENIIFGKTSDITKAEHTLTVEEYRKRHPHLRISNVCYYRTGTTGREGNDIRDIVSQHAVVFVSSDTTLTEDLLAEKWVEERTKNDGNHSVRMIILRNKGVTFSDLVNGQSEYSVERDHNDWTRVPYETKPMAYRMLVALWNFRADLENFITALNNLGINDSNSDEIDTTIKNYANAVNEKLKDLPEEDKYSKIEKAVAEVLSEHPEFQRIELLNDGLSKIKRFRLGCSSKNNFIIRKINKREAYSKDEFKDNVYGIFVTYEEAKKLQESVNGIFSLLNPILKITKDGLPIATSERLGDKKGHISWKINENTRDKLTITMDNSVIEFPEVGYIRYLPILLTKLYGRAGVYSEIGDEFNFENSGSFTYTINKEEFSLDLEELIKQGSDLLDMLELCMFGTTGDIYKNNIKATDAYFKNGFYIDPMSFVNEKSLAQYSGGNFMTVGNSERCFFINVDVTMPRVYLRRNTKKKNPEIEVLPAHEEPRDFNVEKSYLNSEYPNDLPQSTMKLNEYFLKTKEGDKSIQEILNELKISSDGIDFAYIAGSPVLEIMLGRNNIVAVIDVEKGIYGTILNTGGWKDEEASNNLMNLLNIFSEDKDIKDTFNLIKEIKKSDPESLSTFNKLSTLVADSIPQEHELMQKYFANLHCLI